MAHNSFPVPALTRSKPIHLYFRACSSDRFAGHRTGMSSQGPSPRVGTVRKDRVPAMTPRLVKIRPKTRKKAALKTAKPSRKPMGGDKNRLGTDGFEFVEYAAPALPALNTLFEKMGFSAVARHRSKDVTLSRQGDINFILNHEPHSFAQSFARVHGPSVCAFAIRVKDAAHALHRAASLGGKVYRGKVGPMELNI